jgi:hypothetical protein
MVKNKHLTDWSCILSKQMPHLSIPQAIGLATWSCVVMTQSSSLTQVSHLIAQLNGEKPNTVRQRLIRCHCQRIQTRLMRKVSQVIARSIR